MKHTKRFLLASMLFVLIIAAGLMVSFGIEVAFNTWIGVVVLSLAIMGALFALCWRVAGGILR